MAAELILGDVVRVANPAGTLPIVTTGDIGYVDPDFFGQIGTVRMDHGDGCYEVFVDHLGDSQGIHRDYLSPLEMPPSDPERLIEWLLA